MHSELFSSSAADWNMQLAATRKGGRKRCAICSQIYQRRMQAEFIESGALRRVIAVYRAKHRLQPCEPKPRPAEARRIYKSPFLTGLAPLASAREQLLRRPKQSLRTKQRALFLNKANAACGGEPGDSRSGEPPRREAAARAILRIAKPIKPAVKQPQPNNYFLI